MSRYRISHSTNDNILLDYINRVSVRNLIFYPVYKQILRGELAVRDSRKRTQVSTGNAGIFSRELNFLTMELFLLNWRKAYERRLELSSR